MLVPLPALLMLLQAPSDEVVTGRDAQVRLADLLANADSIDAVIGKRGRVTFEVVNDGDEVEAIARTREARSPSSCSTTSARRRTSPRMPACPGCPTS